MFLGVFPFLVHPFVILPHATFPFAFAVFHLPHTTFPFHPHVIVALPFHDTLADVAVAIAFPQSSMSLTILHPLPLPVHFVVVHPLIVVVMVHPLILAAGPAIVSSASCAPNATRGKSIPHGTSSSGAQVIIVGVVVVVVVISIVMPLITNLII